jgi:signal transduction histidine kinase
MFFATSPAPSQSPASVASVAAPCPKSQQAIAHPQQGSSRTSRTCALSLALVTLIFAVDLCLPLGVASAVPYSFAVLLALKARPGWFGAFVAALCIILTVLKMALVPDRGTTELWKVVTNRCLAIFAIGMTTILGMLRRQAEWERKQADERLREHQAALTHMGRLTLLGQVTASVAHELNQPLAAIRLNAELAERAACHADCVPSEILMQLRDLTVQSARAGDIVHRIRRLARRSAFDPELVDLNEIAMNAVTLLNWRMNRAGIAVRIEQDSVSCWVSGDRIQLEQVLVNLLQNASDSLAHPLDRPKQIGIRLVSKDGHVTVRIRDNGPGIPEGIQLFEPFTTTKPEGLGLGLAICRSIVETHGGHIAGTPVEGGGAEFTVTFPIAKREQ